MIGPQVFRSYDAPRYRRGFSIHLVFYGLQAVVLVLLCIHLVLQNRIKKEKRIDQVR
ncbi:hypothetical protein T439DRAFT_328675 [Meredithblackwellia eburnea MCA 4105]